MTLFYSCKQSHMIQNALSSIDSVTLRRALGQKRQGFKAQTCTLFRIIASNIKGGGKKINSQQDLYAFFFPCALGAVA